MNIQDPISDLLIQIKNAYLSKKDNIIINSSKFKINLLEILKKEAFLNDYAIIKENKKEKIKINLKYYGKKNSIVKNIKRISKPSLRVYIKYKKIKENLNNFGITIISTPIGLLTHKDAIKFKKGGEVICTIE